MENHSHHQLWFSVEMTPSSHCQWFASFFQLLFLVCSESRCRRFPSPPRLSFTLYWFAYTLHSVETSYVYKCNGSTSERFICFRNRCETLTWRFSRFVRLFRSPRKCQKLKFVAIVVCEEGACSWCTLWGCVYCKCINHRLRFSFASCATLSCTSRVRATDNVIAVASV